MKCFIIQELTESIYEIPKSRTAKKDAKNTTVDNNSNCISSSSSTFWPANFSHFTNNITEEFLKRMHTVTSNL